MDVCVSVNSKYVRYLYVMLYSLFSSNEKHEINVYVLQQDLTAEDRGLLFSLAREFSQLIYFVVVDSEKFAGVPTSMKFSVEAYFRLHMPWLIPESVKRVLYLDADILVRGDISEIFELDLAGCLFAACQDGYIPFLDEKREKKFHRKSDYRYFNSGVMLWDLVAIRREYAFQDFMDAAKELDYWLPFVDQDILNYMTEGKVCFLPPDEYNCMVGVFANSEKDISKAKILHYAGRNPWRAGPKTEAYKLWWKVARKAPFYLELLEEQVQTLEQGPEDQEILKRKAWEIKRVFEMAYYLKGSGKIKSYVEKFKGGVVLYGAGDIGESMMRFFEDDGASRPMGFIDRVKGGELGGIPIYPAFDWMPNDGKLLLIATPSEGTEKIVHEIRGKVGTNVLVLSAGDFLEECALSLESKGEACA